MSVLGLILFGPGAHAGSFEKIKANLGSPGCHSVEFLSIIESDIFDVVDTAAGQAYIASDGRYNVRVGDEFYIYDSKHIYTYSESTGQLIVEKVEGRVKPREEISLIISLDEIYETHPTDRSDRYRLTKRPEVSSAYPDSIYVSIDTTKLMLEQFEYLDVNEELNRIVFLKQQHQVDCDTTHFEPDVPDSVEVIRL